MDDETKNEKKIAVDELKEVKSRLTKSPLNQHNFGIGCATVHDHEKDGSNELSDDYSHSSFFDTSDEHQHEEEKPKQNDAINDEDCAGECHDKMAVSEKDISHKLKCGTGNKFMRAQTIKKKISRCSTILPGQ